MSEQAPNAVTVACMSHNSGHHMPLPTVKEQGRGVKWVKKQPVERYQWRHNRHAKVFLLVLPLVVLLLHKRLRRLEIVQVCRKNEVLYFATTQS